MGGADRPEPSPVLSVVRARCVVSGRVQGVFFRVSTVERARAIGGISGAVRNRADGAVEVDVQGSKDRVDRIIAWLAVGPPQAAVDRVDVSWIPPDEAVAGFRIEG